MKTSISNACYSAMKKFNWTKSKLKSVFDAPVCIVQRIQDESPSLEIANELVEASWMLRNQVGF